MVGDGDPRGRGGGGAAVRGPLHAGAARRAVNAPGRVGPARRALRAADRRRRRHRLRRPRAVRRRPLRGADDDRAPGPRRAHGAGGPRDRPARAPQPARPAGRAPADRRRGLRHRGGQTPSRRSCARRRATRTARCSTATQDTVTLTLADAGAVAAAALRTLRPELADQLEDERVVLLQERVGSVTGDLARFGDDAHLLAWVLLLLASGRGGGRRRARARQAALRGAARAGGARRRAARGAGDRVRPGDRARGRRGEDDRAAARAVWDAYLGDLTKLGLLLAGIGAVVAAAASSLIPRVELDLRGLWARVTARTPATWLRVARGVVLVVLGGLAIADPLGLLRFVITLAGLAAVYTGLVSLLRLVQKPAAAADRTRSRRRAAVVAVVAAAVLVVAGAAATFVATGGLSEPVADGERPLQRPRRALRPPARRGRPRRHAQRDVGPAPGLVLRAAGAADPGPARGRRARAADRHPLRRPAAERPCADRLRRPRGAAGRRSRRTG